MQDIRYIKLHIHLVMHEATTLPRHKASALRGGMGEMLLRMHCIRDRNCEACDFETECLVRRTMYSKMEIQPAFMSKGDSVGYVLECEDEREVFSEGDELVFHLLLFGKTIVYFSQFLQAIYQLGVHGLGKNKSTFSVKSITNTTGEVILSGTDIAMDRVRVMYLSDYVEYRKRKLVADGPPYNLHLELRTPLSLKYRGELQKEFHAEALMEACARRLYVLNCFEGIETELTDIREHIPEIARQEARPGSVKRYSSTHDEKIRLEGYYGAADLTQIDETALELLIAGELIHIGKNTSFGFGRYQLTGV